MPIAAGRRFGLALVLGLVAGVLVVTVLPRDPGAIRVAGVGALWWLAVVAVPLVATLAVSGLARASVEGTPGLATAAAWTVPVVVVTVATHTFSGAADGPVLGLTALVAPLAALLMTPAAPGQPPNPVASVATMAGAGVVLWASISMLADVAQILSARRWQAAVVVGALALLASEWRPRDAGGRPPLGGWLLVAGAAGVVVPVVVVGAVLAAAPWTAWSRAAARPAFTFGEQGIWATEGRPFAEPRTFAFTEAHRVTALAPGAYRIVEPVGPGRVTREWRLSAGDTLTLRPGDRLVLEAGARVRFEAGRRVPGAPPSGAVWADPPERNSVGAAARALGVALTLVGGALVLTRAPTPVGRGGARVAPALLLIVVLAAVSWGVYGALAAPELAIGAPALAGLFELPALVVPGPVGRALAVTAVLALLLLCVAGACALRGVVGAPARSGPGRTLVWAGLVLAAVAASLWPGDAWRLYLAGCGLAASAAGAPRLAGGGRTAEICGSLIGAAAFLLLGVGGAELPAWAGIVGAYPVLLAAPLAFVVVRAEAVVRTRRAVR